MPLADWLEAVRGWMVGPRRASHRRAPQAREIGWNGIRHAAVGVGAMSSIEQRYLLPFEIKFLKLKAQAFQDWVVEILDLAYPGDFSGTRLGTPNGGGDWGCDGYRLSTAAVYQIYAPQVVKPTTVNAKIKSDFERAMDKLRTEMKNWIFVCNTDTLAVKTNQLLGELQTKHPAVTISFMKKNELWDIVRNLDMSRLRRLFPHVRDDFGPTDHYSERVIGSAGVSSLAGDNADDRMRDGVVEQPELANSPASIGDGPTEPPSRHVIAEPTRRRDNRSRGLISICLCFVAITGGDFSFVHIESITSRISADTNKTPDEPGPPRYPFERVPNVSNSSPLEFSEAIEPDSPSSSEETDERSPENRASENGSKTRFKLRPPSQPTPSKTLRPYTPDLGSRQLPMSQS